MMIILFIVILLLLAVVYISAFVLYVTTHTINHVHLEPKIILEQEKNSIIMHHTQDARIMNTINKAKDCWYEQYSKKTFEKLQILSHDKLRLTGYYYPATKSSSLTVIIVHGLYDSAAGVAYLANEYHSRDWNVFTFDQRAHGESEGTKRTMGGNESKDLAKWIAFIEERYNPCATYIHGISMGATTTLILAQNSYNKNRSVKGIIIDSAYDDYMLVFARIVNSVIKNMFLSKILAITCSFVAKVFSGVSFYKINPGNQMHTIHYPVLLFHGQKDILVPLGSIRKFLNPSLKPLIETVVVPEAPHIGPYFYAPSLYMKKIEGFIQRTIK